MATTYLTLVNNVLNELNESELTASTFASSRGVQTAVKKFVLKAMHEVYSTLQEVPTTYQLQTLHRQVMLNIERLITIPFG